MVSKPAECNTHVDGGHSQGINFVTLGLFSKRVKRNTEVDGGHSQGINFVTLAWSQSL
jgi:hypothetical protein